MNNVVATPIYGKTLKIFSKTKWPMTLKLSMLYQVPKYYKYCSNYDPEMILTYFTPWSNLVA